MFNFTALCNLSLSLSLLSHKKYNFIFIPKKYLRILPSLILIRNMSILSFFLLFFCAFRRSWALRPVRRGHSRRTTMMSYHRRDSPGTSSVSNARYSTRGAVFIEFGTRGDPWGAHPARALARARLSREVKNKHRKREREREEPRGGFSIPRPFLSIRVPPAPLSLASSPLVRSGSVSLLRAIPGFWARVLSAHPLIRSGEALPSESRSRPPEAPT